MIDLFLPETRHPAIEERYASKQAALHLMRSAPGAKLHRYAPGTSLSELARIATSEFFLVATGDRFVAERHLVPTLERALHASSSSVAAFPRSNEATEPRQKVHPAYVTLGQFEESVKQLNEEGDTIDEITSWQGGDPAVALVRRTWALQQTQPLVGALHDTQIVIASNSFVHVFASHRGQARTDLLERISPSATSILEFGCGEGALGEAVKQRQQCRYIGVELDSEAASLARQRLDRVVEGDVRELITNVGETFDCIVGGDILEHLDDPWSFLTSLRDVCRPGAKLLLSLPNISAWPVVRDLLRGRFDYTYLGVLCAGHVRFFTRQTICDLLEMSGWKEVSISDQDHFPPGAEDFFNALDRSGLEYARRELLPLGHYVIAEYDPTRSPL